jgi:hypothetical protein
MKWVACACLLISLFAACDFWKKKQQSSGCPDIEDFWTQARSAYVAHGRITADTLTDSFAPMSAGTTWEYEYTATGLEPESDTTIVMTTCGTISFQVIQNNGATAVIKTGTGQSACFDTLRLTDDSITNADTIDSIAVLFQTAHPSDIPNFIPVLIGQRKKVYPCYKFDDGSGYSYVKMFDGLYLYGEYFNGYGLTYLSGVPGKNSGNQTVEDIVYSFILVSFNGQPVDVQPHIYEGLSKFDYGFATPDSVIASSKTIR